jgi:hypothetical protein
MGTSMIMDCLLIGALVSTAAVAIHPIELDDVISNPGMGWQSFYTGYPPGVTGN